MAAKMSSTVKNRIKKKIGRGRRRKCVYCGQNRGPLTLDHRIPKSRGGWNTKSNLQLTCRPCNQAKGSMTDAEFRESLEPEFSREIPGHIEASKPNSEEKT